MKPTDPESSRPYFSFSPNIFGRRSGTSPNVPIHPLVLLLLLMLVFGTIIGVGAYIIFAKPVTLIIEDVPQYLRTHQGTVEGMLQELGVLVDPEDVVAPSLDTPITYYLTVTIDKAETVILQVDGETRRFRTHLLQPADILAEAGIILHPSDAVMVDSAPIPAQPLDAAPRHIQVIRAIEVTIVEDGSTRTAVVLARTVGTALSELKVPLYLADQVSPALDASLAAGDTITITRSIPLTIQADGQILRTRTRVQTVAATLAEVGVAPLAMDYTIPDEREPTSAGMVIQVVRVLEIEVVLRREEPFERQRRIDRALTSGQEKIIQAGVDGIIEDRVIVRYEDGVEVARTTIRTTVIQKSVPEITMVAPTP